MIILYMISINYKKDRQKNNMVWKSKKLGMEIVIVTVLRWKKMMSKYIHVIIIKLGQFNWIIWAWYRIKKISMLRE